MRVEVDADLCEANAICVGIAPDVFNVDKDDALHILQPDVPVDREADVRQAVTLCPKVALSLKEQ